VSVRFDVDLDELDDTIASMTAFLKRLEDRLDHLDTTVADLHLTWVGDAAVAQRAAHEEWTRGARLMHQGLGEMIAAARLAHANYSAAATANQQMWGQLG
jgi:WXG100 family type VII secretion target